MWGLGISWGGARAAVWLPELAAAFSHVRVIALGRVGTLTSQHEAVYHAQAVLYAHASDGMRVLS